LETASKNKKQKKQQLHKHWKEIQIDGDHIMEGRTTPDDNSDEVNDGEMTVL